MFAERKPHPISTHFAALSVRINLSSSAYWFWQRKVVLDAPSILAGRIRVSVDLWNLGRREASAESTGMGDRCAA